MWKGYAEGVCGGGMQRGTRRGYAEGVHGGVHGGGMQRGSVEGYAEGSLQLNRLCGEVSLQLGCLEGCHSN